MAIAVPCEVRQCRDAGHRRMGLVPGPDATKAGGTRGQWAGAACAPGARLRGILLISIMLAALAPAVFLGLGASGVSRCGPTARPRHTEAAPSWQLACRPVPHRVAYQRLPSG